MPPRHNAGLARFLPAPCVPRPEYPTGSGSFVLSSSADGCMRTYFPDTPLLQGHAALCRGIRQYSAMSPGIYRPAPDLLARAGLPAARGGQAVPVAGGDGGHAGQQPRHVALAAVVASPRDDAACGGQREAMSAVA